MKGLFTKVLASTGMAIALSSLTALASAPAQAFYGPEDAQPNNNRYDNAWNFTCLWFK